MKIIVRAKQNRRARGSVYVAILGLSMLVAVIGLGGVVLSRTQSRVADLQSDVQEARGYALAAIEIGRAMIAKDVNWRTTRTNGVWVNNQVLGNGRISLSVVNPAGVLNRAASDSVVLTATGTKGSAVQMVEVTLNATVTPYTSLKTALTANAITLGTGSMKGTSVTMASVTTIVGSTGSTEPDVEAAGVITGSGYTGTYTPNATARTMPDPTVFDHYLTNGTAISLASLPLVSGAYQMSGVLLSPAANPYGAGNTRGIYVIDCGGAAIRVQDCRVVGTLVLLNTGAGSSVQGAMHFAAVETNYPVLLVKGPVSLGFSNSLNESSSVNYNPAGTPYPYPGGVTNATGSDTYPATSALMYVSGNATISNNNVLLKNLIVGGTFSAGNFNGVTFSYTSEYFTNPPPGFFSCPMTAGVWRQVTN
jgi:hypothetical protein